MPSVTIHLPGVKDWDVKTQRLVDAVVRAHEGAATANNNCSNGGAVNAFHGSGSFRQAVVGAIMTIGNHHGPIGDARVVFEHWTDSDFEACKEKDELIPGFGNSFFKKQIDPAWCEVSKILEYDWQEQALRLHSISRHVPVPPNAAMFTAIACGIAGIPHGYEELLFLLPRIPVWAVKCQQTHT